MVDNYFQTYYVLLMTINFTFTIVVMLAACLCCKRRLPKNELLGLEGMVKLKNPDEVIVITTVGHHESQADLNLSTISNADSDKRASTAAHRSLPDIPVAETNGDNGSELYETVADKKLLNAQNRRDKSPAASLKKLSSVSQHSSISQADDVSSPYSRVKNLPHDYAKVRSTEHPYAQLHAPSTSAAAAAAAAVAASSSNSIPLNESLNRISQHSDSTHNVNASGTGQVEIPAASAIAGMISASQDLPYMTPPITNQHFSGDSVDSSKGYTSISVREPLANILAQQPVKPLQRNAALTRETSDSHYATVSDDSDETYAAIEDPNIRLNVGNAAEIYTSGSETYAQIQPMQSNATAMVVVSVEINNSNDHSSMTPSILVGGSGNGDAIRVSNSSSALNADVAVNTTSSSAITIGGSRPLSTEHATNIVLPVPPPVDSLRAQMHSRQASSASNNSSSVGNLGSPKPEKRQANSPLPPTPTSKTQLASARSSVISVIELGALIEPTIVATDSPQKKSKSLSPSKDIEGMYAKVMKKNKLSRQSPTSQHNSPVLTRKHNDSTVIVANLGVAPLDAAATDLIEARSISISATNDGSNRMRSNSYSSKDHGYETIPADAARMSGAVAGTENRKSDGYAHILRKERTAEKTQKSSPSISKIIDDKPTQTLLHRNSSASEKHYETIASNVNDPGYETLTKHKTKSGNKKTSDYDPNYEMLMPLNEQKLETGLSDDGYAKVLEKKSIHLDEGDAIDGYSKVRGDEEQYDGEGAVGGYSTIGTPKNMDKNHNYASIGEARFINEQSLEQNSVGSAQQQQQQMEEEEDSCAQETESDHYARINEQPVKSRPPELSINSPTSTSSSLFCSTSSANSSTTITTTSTLSSRQTPSSSQYESFTGSDTDPNYESVCYLNSTRENPYERLYPDNSESQLSSPHTPEISTASSTLSSVATAGIVKKPANGHMRTDAHDQTPELVVDDFIQVL